MAIGRALVDRARVLRRVRTATKVEGSSVYAETTEAWFKARLVFESAEGEQAENSHTRVNRTPLLIFALRTEENTPIDIGADDRVEVESLGQRSKWEVSSAVQPLRRRVTLLGGMVHLRHVDEP